MPSIRWRDLVVTGVVGLVVVAALILVAMAHWRRGSALLAVGLALAAVLRLVLPTARMGPLAVRSKTFDVLFYAGLAAALVLLAGPSGA